MTWLWIVAAIFACAVVKGVWEFFFGECDCEGCSRLRYAEKEREWVKR
jgi:hypothetical protein